jgi:hypothetical protein
MGVVSTPISGPAQIQCAHKALQNSRLLQRLRQLGGYFAAI